MKIFLISAGACFLSTSAMAADVVFAPFSTPMAAPVYSWSGGYLGLQGGGVFSDIDAGYQKKKRYETLFSGGLDGGYFGVFGGWNVDIGNNFIAGIEGDVNYVFDETRLNDFFDVGTDWTYGLRARFGYASDRALLFVSGGWAGARASVDTPYYSITETFNGWSVGLGLDYAFTDKTFGRVEYRYSDYGSIQVNGYDVSLNQHRIGLGFGVKF